MNPTCKKPKLTPKLKKISQHDPNYRTKKGHLILTRPTAKTQSQLNPGDGLYKHKIGLTDLTQDSSSGGTDMQTRNKSYYLSFFMTNSQMLSFSLGRCQATHCNPTNHMAAYKLTNCLTLLPRIIHTNIFKCTFL